MKDLTVIFLTLNKVPDKWAQYHKEVLFKAIGDADLITISKEPMRFGKNLIQEEEPSVNNIYRQILRGAKEATTKYIAIAEDDVLYPPDHFEYRPESGVFAYNGHRWGLHTWGEPVFYHKPRISNATLIAERDLVVNSLTERFTKYPNNQIGELGKEKGTQLNRYETKRFWSKNGVVYFSHVFAIDHLEQQQRKRAGVVQAYEIPYWGRSYELVEKFK